MGDKSPSVSCPLGVQREWSHPIGMNTKPSLATGLAGVFASAVAAGIIASSSGRARAACTPFRNVRRGKAFFMMIMAISSSAPHLKRDALHDAQQDRREAVSPRLG